MSTEIPTSPDEPIVNIIVISGDLHTLGLGANNGLPPGEYLAREIACLLSSSPTSSVRKHSSSPPMSNRQRKARMWHAALQKKRRGAQMMFAAQQVIEEVEEEIAESVPRDTLDKLHAQYYGADGDSDSGAETYIARVSAVRVQPRLEASESASD